MSYASQAGNHAEELRESLSPDDEEHLREDLDELGIEGWLAWADKARDEANDYLRATVKQRTQKKKWQEPTLRRRLVLIAYHQARLASSLIYAASSLGPGREDRGNTAYAATLAFQVMKDGDWRWPFPSDPPEGWPGPHIEPYLTVSSSSRHEIKQGFDYT